MKSIIITGASSGIGRETAEYFLSKNWRVGLIARRADALAEVVHDNAVHFPCDVTDETAVDAAFAGFGHLDVLFNNAGMFGPQTTIDRSRWMNGNRCWTSILRARFCVHAPHSGKCAIKPHKVGALSTTDQFRPIRRAKDRFAIRQRSTESAV